MPPTSILDWIALRLLPGLGPILRRRALERFGNPGEIAHALPASAFHSLPRMSAQILARLLDGRRGLRGRAEREWRRCERAGIRILTPDDEAFPAALRELPDAPVLLYLRGELPPAVVRVAVVGSRTPTNYGRRVAIGLAAGLAARGAEVVSGGAYGIDTCAHRGALEEEGRTVAVLGSGLARPYPEENAALFDEIAEKGAVLTEYPLDARPEKQHFLARNRLISGLAAATVVVEAAARSGSLSTANHALEQGREVLAVPGPVSSARSEGCNRLIQQGAKLVQNIEDILEELPPLYRGGLAPAPSVVQCESRPDSPILNADEAAVLALLDGVEPSHLDDLAQRAPFGIGRLQAGLFGLELCGAVERSPGGYYVLRPRKES